MVVRGVDAFAIFTRLQRERLGDCDVTRFVTRFLHLVTSLTECVVVGGRKERERE